MKNIRQLLNSFTEEDYRHNRVNLHIHTSHSDGEGNETQVLDSAKANRYKLISITDHNTCGAHQEIQDEILLTGVEFDCWYNCVYIHVLAYGIDINNPNLTKFFAKSKKETEAVLPRLFSKRNLKELIECIHDAGGVAILAHPACYWALNLEKFILSLAKIGLDGIEVYYPYPRLRKVVKFHSAKDVEKIAEKYPQFIKTGGTDFHGKTF